MVKFEWSNESEKMKDLLRQNLIAGGLPKISARATADAIASYVRAEIEAAVLKMCGALNEEEKEPIQIDQPKQIPSTVPPLAYGSCSWHILTSERSTSPCVAQWFQGHWSCGGEKDLVTPEAMWLRSWRWHSAIDFEKLGLENPK